MPNDSLLTMSGGSALTISGGLIETFLTHCQHFTPIDYALQ